MGVKRGHRLKQFILMISPTKFRTLQVIRAGAGFGVSSNGGLHPGVLCSMASRFPEYHRCSDRSKRSL